MFRQKFLYGLLIVILSGSVIYAGGSKNTPYSGTVSLAAGGLNYAGLDNFSVLTTNPAGLSYMNKSGLFFSVSDVVKQNEFYRDSVGLFKSYGEDFFNLAGGIYWKPSDNLGLSIAYYPSVSHNNDWPYVIYEENDSNTVILPFNLYNKIEVNTIAPSVSYKAGKFSIGVTADIHRFSYKTAYPLSNPFWAIDSGNAAYQYEVEADAWAYGFTISVMYDFSPELRFGAIAKSGYTASLEGTAKTEIFRFLDSATVNKDVSGDMEVPWMFGAGINYALNEKTAINIDINYSLWGSTAESVENSFADPLWQNRVEDIDTMTFIPAGKISLDLQNSFSGSIGITHTMKKFTIRAGYRYSQSPNTEVTYSFLYPDTDEHWLSLGLSYEQENYILNAAFAYGFGVEKTIGGSRFEELNGSYDSETYLPSVSLHYKF